MSTEKIIGYAAILRYSTHTFNYESEVGNIDALYTGTTARITYIRTQSQNGPVFCNKADIHPTKQAAKIAAQNSKTHRMRYLAIDIVPVYASEIGANSPRLFFKHK